MGKNSSAMHKSDPEPNLAKYTNKNKNTKSGERVRTG